VDRDRDRARDDLRDRALELDGADELARFRDRFAQGDADLVYLNGNSLGRLPLAAIDRVSQVVREEWGDDLSRSFGSGWVDLPVRVGNLLAASALGARPGEVLVADSTTVALYKLAWAALDARAERSTIVADSDDFPTDRYVLEGLAAERGAQIRWISADAIAGPSLGHVEALLDSDVALVCLSHVGYRSSAVADISGITAAAHRAGALVLFDLCHSAGVIEIGLESTGVDLAVGCTYKYLSGGPGSPGFLYVRRDLQERLSQPIWGWWSRHDMMSMGHGYERAAGINAYLGGTPGIIGLSVAEEGVRITAEAGLTALRAKNVALTTFAIELFDSLLAPEGFRLGSPRESARRGAHVAFCHRGGRELVHRLESVGVVSDFRMPDTIRFGLAPLTTSFVDVYEGCVRLADLAS
jgi:kynureninase